MVWGSAAPDGGCVNYNLDIRFDINLHTCGKFVTFQEVIGPAAMYHLTALWCGVARQYPDGHIVRGTPGLIATLTLYRGKAQVITDALLATGWLEQVEDGYMVHDWTEHQPWAAGAPARVASARNAAKAKWENMTDEARVAQARKAAKRRWHPEEEGGS